MMILIFPVVFKSFQCHILHLIHDLLFRWPSTSFSLLLQKKVVYALQNTNINRIVHHLRFHLNTHIQGLFGIIFYFSWNTIRDTPPVYQYYLDMSYYSFRPLLHFQATYTSHQFPHPFLRTPQKRFSHLHFFKIKVWQYNYSHHMDIFKVCHLLLEQWIF